MAGIGTQLQEPIGEIPQKLVKELRTFQRYYCTSHDQYEARNLQNGHEVFVLFATYENNNYDTKAVCNKTKQNKPMAGVWSC